MLYAAGGSFWVLSPSQGAAEGVRSRDNPPTQPRPVEAHLGTANSHEESSWCSWPSRDENEQRTRRLPENAGSNRRRHLEQNWARFRLKKI